MSKEADVTCDGDSSSADECDNNKSFVKKVTSHVSGFIPQTLSKWFGAKLRQRDDFDDEDETYELPPPKRIKKSSSDNLFDINIVGTPLHGQKHNPFSTDTFREPVPGPSNINARKLVLPASNHYNRNRTDQTNGDSDSGESTSGYSSMPRIGSKELVSDLPRQSNLQPVHDNTTIGQHKSIFNTSIPHERTLFGDALTSPPKTNSSLSSRRPSFNASAFGAPNFMDKTLSTRRIFDSPFYHGRISYGGAAAYNTSILNSSPEVPRNPSIQPKLINENKSAALSKTAKRILDTLEQYTSPVQDVRRIPTGRRGPRPEGLIGKYLGANPYSVREVSKAPCNKELQVPTMTDLLKMKLKERLQDSTSTVRDLASTSSSSLNNEAYSIKANDDDKQATGKNRNKIKTKVSFTRQRASGFCLEPGPVNLPDVQLPISTLPSFNFSIPLSKPTVSKPEQSNNSTETTDKISNPLIKPASSVTATVTPISVSSPTPPINFLYPEVKTNNQPILPFSKIQSSSSLSKPEQTMSTMKKSMEFRFSKPLVIAENKFKSIKAINNFKFSMPLVKKVCNGFTEIKKSTENTDVTEKPLPKIGFGDVFKIGSDKWECDVCMVRNQAAEGICVSCTSPKPSVKPVVNGSGKSALIPPVAMWGDKFKAPSNSWECSMCMVQNDSGKTKCIACENPKSASDKAAISSKATSIGFKKKENEWECSSCMVRNPDSKQKCVCCEAAKPSAKTLPATSATPLLTTSSWGDKFKAPPSSWECSMCLVRNEVAKEKCVACENPRPVGIVVSKGVDGFKKVGEWECTSCMVKNPNNKLKCICCEAQKPCSKPVPTAQVSEVPKFSFGIENGLINGHGFMFGIPADKNTKKDNTSVEDSAAPATAETKKSETNTTPAQFSFGIKSPNGAKSLPAATISGISETAKQETKTLSYTFGVPAAKKRPLNDDETPVSGTLKKIDTQVSPANNPNSINGTIGKSETSQPPKFTFAAHATPAAPNKSPTFAFSAPKATENPIIANAATKTTLSGSSVKPFSFGGDSAPSLLVKNDAKSIFGASAGVTTSPTTSPALNLQAKPTLTDVNATTAEAIFKFGSNASAAPAPKSTPSMFSAGSNSTSTNGPVPTFNFSAPNVPEKPAESATPSFTFNGPAANNTNSAFSTPSTNFNAPSATSVFGSSNNNAAINATSIFGASAPSTNTTNNIFGNSAGQSTPLAPAFGGASNHTGSIFAAAKTQPASFGSGAPAPAFGAAASNAGGSTFGKSAAANGVFNFGGPSQSREPEKPTFNFGGPSSSTAAPSTFNFGASANAPCANGGFNFNSGSNHPTVPNFNASAKPSFNFTGGAPTSFTSTKPPPARVIRRAIRRTQR